MNRPSVRHWKGAGALDGLTFMTPGRRGGLTKAILADDASERAKPRLPTLTFLERRFPGESTWARERIPMKVVE